MARATTAETGGDAAAQWLGLRPLGMEAAAMNSSPKAKEKCPSIRAKAKQPPRGQKRPFSATPKRVPRRGVVAAQNEEEDLEEEEEEDHGHHEQRGALPERPKRSSRSATGDRKRPANSKKSEAPTPSRPSSGRTTTLRRAAIAAEAALLRLREDNESSDGSLTL